MDAQLHKVLFNIQVIFNDAVVHQGNAAVFADMGVGVGIVGLTVGGPAGVADAQRPLQVRSAVRQVQQHLKPPLGFFHLQPPLS